MEAALKPLQDWFAARPRNEQLLVVLAGAALAAYLLVQIIGAPLARYAKQENEAVAKQSAALTAVQTKLATLRPEDLAQTRRERDEKITALRAQLAEQEALLSALRNGVVKKGEMGEVLAAMMRGHTGVTVTDLKSLPAVPLAAPPAADDKTAKADGEMYYKHPLRIQVTGRYVALARYVAALEKLPWKIFWIAMELDAQDGVEAHAKLELFTISQEASWFAAS